MDILSYTKSQEVKEKFPLGEIVEVVGTTYDGTYLPADGTSLLRSEYVALDQMYPADPVSFSSIGRSLPWAYLDACTYGNGMYVAVGGQGYILYSKDTIVWGSVAGQPGPQDGRYMQYQDGLFVSSNYISGNIYWSSVGSAGWSTYALNATGLGGMTFDGSRHFVTSHNDGKMFSATTADLLSNTWTETAMPAAGIYDVAFGNGIYVGVGSNTIRSTDGNSWSIVAGPGAYFFQRIIFADGLFVAISDSGTRIATSSDGIAWTVSMSPIPSLKDITFGDGVYIIVGVGVMCYSTNGYDWTAYSIPSGPWVAITHGPTDTFLVVDGNNNQVARVLTYTPQDTMIDLPNLPGLYVRVK